MKNPKHVGFILDGNRRWAKARGLPKSAGHKRGFEHISDVLEMCRDFGIHIVSAYCWSTENWGRSADEIEYIIRSLQKHLPRFVNGLHEKGFRFLHSGRREELSPKTLQVIDHAVSLTEHNESGIFNFLFNYGGRAEIVRAVQHVIKNNNRLEDITESSVSSNLWTSGLPDVDLVIRSGGEQRLSNFMLWQIADATIFVTETFWPDIGKKEIAAGIENFNAGRANR